MTEAELRHAIGDRVYDAFAPHGLLLQHDAEDPDGLIYLGQTDQGEDVEINRRAAESDLLVYVNINLVAMDGGHKSVATGLASYRSLRHHHNVRDHAPLPLLHGPGALRAALVQLAHGPADRSQRASRSSRSRPPSTTTPFPSRWRSCSGGSGNGRARDRATYLADHQEPVRGPAPGGAVDLPVDQGAPRHDRRARRRGRGRARGHHRHGLPPAAGRRRGPDRRRRLRAAPPVPLQRQLDHEPDPGHVHGPRLPVQPVPGPAAGARGRAWPSFPTRRRGRSIRCTIPSYIDFFEEVLSDTTDPVEIEKTYEERFATDEWYRHLYRTSHAYHGVHPFYMWYWGAHALEHLGRVIIVGGDPGRCAAWASRPRPRLTDALEMATDTVGRDPTITHLHCPPIMLADVH